MSFTVFLSCILLFFSFFFFFLLSANAVGISSVSATTPVSALFIFGDSTVDSGNNNHLLTISKANFPPYGRDFPGRKATGRFCNGKIATDLLSEILGLSDTVPAYLDRDFRGTAIIKGASFASAASGYYNCTSELTNVLTIEEQIDLFRKYKFRLKHLVGPNRMLDIISNGYFIMSCGTVDFTNLYYLDPFLQAKYNVSEFQGILLQSLSSFTTEIYAEGARRLGVLSLPPFGCLPSQITLHNFFEGTCVDSMNEVAISTNSKMDALLTSLKHSLPGFDIKFLNVYDVVLDMSKNPNKFGFEESRKGCCGTGLIEASILCNPLVPVCRNASTHVYWDSYHPSTSAYSILLQSILEQVFSS